MLGQVVARQSRQRIGTAVAGSDESPEPVCILEVSCKQLQAVSHLQGQLGLSGSGDWRTPLEGAAQPNTWHHRSAQCAVSEV